MVWTSANGPKCPVSREDRGEFMKPKSTARSEPLLPGDVSMYQGATTLYREMLKSANKPGGSKIPANWKSNELRAEMEAKGWLTSEPVANGWSVLWKITDAGREALSVSRPNCGGEA